MSQETDKLIEEQQSALKSNIFALIDKRYIESFEHREEDDGSVTINLTLFPENTIVKSAD